MIDVANFETDLLQEDYDSLIELLNILEGEIERRNYEEGFDIDYLKRGGGKL